MSAATYLSESVFFCSVICLVWVLFEFCLFYPSVLSIVQSPCVLVSAVSHLIDCFIPQVFSIVCHYLPVSVLFKPQCFSFWLLVRLILFCTCTFLPTPGSSLLCLCDFCLSICLFFWISVFLTPAWLCLVFSLWFVSLYFCPVRTALRFWPSACLLDLPLPVTLNICLWNFILHRRIGGREYLLSFSTLLSFSSTSDVCFLAAICGMKILKGQPTAASSQSEARITREG